MTFRINLVAAACLFASSICAAPQAPVAPVPTPDEEKAQFEVAPGFEVSLFAADPLIDKPIQMNFDPRGRLWLVSSETYPQIKPGSKANDKVLVLEDDGTGHAKAAKIFVDGLLIPTGIAYGHGGVYVSNSTELLHFTEGPDGKAIDKRVMLSGFGTEDTHHILHTLRWAPDGRLNFNQSIYIHSHVETPWGERVLNSGGIWRFEPATMKLDVFIRGLCNPWGQAWDDFGQSFATDGAGGEGVNYCIPGAVYFTYAGASKVLPGLNPGSPKYAGCEIVGGRALPDDWQGLLLTNDFRASRVCRFQLSDDGSGFAAKQLSDVIKSKTNVFRPVDIKMGPDGAIYVADWCNPIINHGEVDFRDPRRDHAHGRIWRVTAKGRPLVDKPKLVDASLDDLLQELKSPEPYTRQQARRVLAERGSLAGGAYVGGLQKFLESLQADDPHVEQYRLEALWASESVDVVDAPLLKSLLNAKDARVRAAAVRVLSHWHEALPEGQTLLAKSVADESPRVRLEAIRALADYPSAKSEELALGALDKPRDRFIDYALYLTTTELKDAWQPAADKGEFKLAPMKLAFALQTIGSKGALKPMLDELKSGQIAAEDKAALVGLISSVGAADDLTSVLDVATSDAVPAPTRVELLTAMTKAAREKRVAPADKLAKLQTLFTADEGLRVAALELAGASKAESLRPALEQTAVAKDATPTVRRAAIGALGSLGGKASVESLTKLCDAANPQAVRFEAAAALVPLNPKAAATAAVSALSAETTDASPTPLFDAFLKRKGADVELAAALQGKTINADAAKLGTRAVYQASRTDSPLLAALSTAGHIDSAAKELTKDQMAALIADVTAKGNPARGEAIFRRKEMACLQCHSIAGTGGIVAPDMLSLGASAPVDYIIDSILLPNKAVKEGYNAIIVTTKDGDQTTGIRVRQNDKELVLKDATRDEIVIPIANVKSTRDGGSIMPSGLADQLTHAEFVDLVRFLSELGKGPYAAAGLPVARKWRVVDPQLPSASSVTPDVLDASTAITWRPEYAQVDGTLPLSSFEGKGRAILRTELTVSTPGPISLKLNGAAGVMLAYFDGKLMDATAPLNVAVAQGAHTVTFVIEHGQRPDGVKLELVDVPGSPAKAQFVGGK